VHWEGKEKKTAAKTPAATYLMEKRENAIASFCKRITETRGVPSHILGKTGVQRKKKGRVHPSLREGRKPGGRLKNREKGGRRVAKRNVSGVFGRNGAARSERSKRGKENDWPKNSVGGETAHPRDNKTRGPHGDAQSWT